MENTKKIWTDYKTGATTEKEAVNLLLELLFRNKFEFGLAAFDEDAFSDFLVFMNSRFEIILRKYNPDVSEFNTYLHSVINLTAFWWKKKIQDGKLKNYCCHNLCIEENFNAADFSPDEKDFYVEEPKGENLIPVTALAKEALRNLNVKIEKKKTLTLSRAKEIISVLALKSCNNITDQQILIAAEITGIPPKEFHRIIQQAEETLHFKKDRMIVLQNKRNFAYFQRKKKMMKEKCLRDIYPELCIEEKSSKEDAKWQKAAMEISVAATALVPSNKTVAKLLNMSSRKVKKLLDEADENFSK
nr:hypothetical protein [uncultured Treponema sp.]